MKKTAILYVLVLFLAACNTSSDQSSKQEGKVEKVKKPNIIIILTDDQGFSDVGFNGSKDILTPNIDAIAKEGIVFSNGYVSHPYCSPSRAGLMTGRYQQRFGHEHNVPFRPEDPTMGTPLEEVFLAEKLKQAGYGTCAIGKWHLGDHENFLPNNRGFDHWFGFSGGHMNFWGIPYTPNKTMHIQRNGKNIPKNELTYLIDDFTDEAIWYIEANSEQPFFMYLSYNAPHSPDHATEKYLAKTAHIEYGTRSVYGAMIAGVDAGVGRIDSLLRAKNIRENTMIVFLSDNGGRLDAANNMPFRGHKGMLFEGGIRVPFAISWPAALPKKTTYDNSVSSLDLFPTCMEAAGLHVKKSDQLDGIDLLPYLTGENTNSPHDNLYWRVANGEEFAIRKGNYKLIKSAYKKKTMLFDLEKDKMEIYDISAQHPEIVKSMTLEYKDWNRQLKPPLWTDLHIENVAKEEKKVQDKRKKSLFVQKIKI